MPLNPEQTQAYYQGFSSALEVADARVHQEQIRSLRKEFGYADRFEQIRSESIMSRFPEVPA